MDQTEVTGRINQPIDHQDKKVEFTLQADDAPYTLLILYFPDQKDPPPLSDYNALKYGANCHIQGMIERPEKSRNPGQFDFQDYLLSKGISYQLIVESLDHIQCTGSTFLDHIFSTRQHLLDKVDERLSSESAGWTKALVFGDKSHI